MLSKVNVDIGIGPVMSFALHTPGLWMDCISILFRLFIGMDNLFYTTTLVLLMVLLF